MVDAGTETERFQSDPFTDRVNRMGSPVSGRLRAVHHNLWHRGRQFGAKGHVSGHVVVNGGIAPKILPVIQNGSLMRRFTSERRFALMWRAWRFESR